MFVDAMEAQATFVIVMFSAMIPGIYTGAKLADYYGGYKGKALKTALTLCVVFGTFATMFSLLETITFNKDIFVVLMWLFLFSGAAIMPIGAGIIVSCVPKFASNSASALYCIFYNLLGCALAPILSGYAMEQYRGQRQGMIVGYRVILVACLVHLILFICARGIVMGYLERLDFNNSTENQDDQPEEVDQDSHTLIEMANSDQVKRSFTPV